MFTTAIYSGVAIIFSPQFYTGGCLCCLPIAATATLPTVIPEKPVPERPVPACCRRGFTPLAKQQGIYILGHATGNPPFTWGNSRVRSHEICP